jgi:hypothetical protein
MSYYLPIISFSSESISIRESKGTSTKGFDYQEFALADSARVLLSNNAAYVNLHHVGEFVIFQRINYADWLKKPVSYILLENPSGVTYSWNVEDGQGWGHKARKQSRYEIIPIDITSKKVSVDIQTDQHRTVLLFKDPSWVKVDPLVHDAIRALEY